MSIHDFYVKFVSANEGNTLLGTLRKVSLIEDPKSMFNEEPLNDWIPWGEIQPGASFASTRA